MNFINTPIDASLKCDVHPDGCGGSVQCGRKVYADAQHCMYYRGLWFIGVRYIDSEGRRTCKIGYIKVPATQLNLVGNRIGVITSFMVRDGNIRTTYTAKGQTELPIKRKTPRKSEDEGTTTKPTKRNSRTMEICACMGDVAFITFLDGGVPQRKPVKRAVANDLDEPWDDGNDDDDDNNDDDDTDVHSYDYSDNNDSSVTDLDDNDNNKKRGGKGVKKGGKRKAAKSGPKGTKRRAK